MSETGTSKGEKTYDLAVIGAGSAGFAAAIAAAELAARVALIGQGAIGGTCVNFGCVPSKTLIRAVGTIHDARSARRFAGVAADGAVTDWAAVVRQKDALVADVRQTKYADILADYDNITYLEGPASLADDGVTVRDTRVKAERIVIATGASPAVPAIPGMAETPHLTTTTALALQQLPASLLVIGGGYAGAELAQTFARAGVRVTLACRSRLLPHAEPEISAALTQYLRDEGIVILPGVEYKNIRRARGKVTLLVAREGQLSQIVADEVLTATGRTPNTEGLGCREQGIELDPSGAIVVDDAMKTTAPGIYAAGDVTGRDKFVYTAAYGAKIAALNALKRDGLRYDRTGLPQVVFTDPQAASAGLTESEARAAGIDVRTSVISLDLVARARAARDTRGLIKLVAARKSGRLVGAHVLAPEGADSVQAAALAIRCGMTVRQLADTLFPYLTTVEGLRLAAIGFDKDVAHLSCCVA